LKASNASKASNAKQVVVGVVEACDSRNSYSSGLWDMCNENKKANVSKQHGARQRKQSSKVGHGWHVELNNESIESIERIKSIKGEAGGRGCRRRWSLVSSKHVIAEIHTVQDSGYVQRKRKKANVSKQHGD
jgi:hypothetical protein